MTPSELLVMRRQYGLTQAEFGARLNPKVSRLTICNWERGRFRIPDDLVLRMTDIAIAKPIQKPRQDNKLTKTTVDAYRKMRQAPNNLSHAYIAKMWSEHGFTPSIEAQAAIAAEWPDILNSNQQEQ